MKETFKIFGYFEGLLRLNEKYYFAIGYFQSK